MPSVAGYNAVQVSTTSLWPQIHPDGRSSIARLDQSASHIHLIYVCPSILWKLLIYLLFCYCCFLFVCLFVCVFFVVANFQYAHLSIKIYLYQAVALGRSGIQYLTILDSWCPLGVCLTGNPIVLSSSVWAPRGGRGAWIPNLFLFLNINLLYILFNVKS